MFGIEKDLFLIVTDKEGFSSSFMESNDAKPASKDIYFPLPKIIIQFWK